MCKVVDISDGIEGEQESHLLYASCIGPDACVMSWAPGVPFY